MRALDHVRWIGGPGGSGKSTIAQLLAEQFDLGLYATDATIGSHSAELGSDSPLLADFAAQGMDERWLRDPGTMLQTFPWFAGERFDRVVADLQALAGPRLTLAEGFRLLPRLVAPLLAHHRQGVWLIATADFRRRVFQARPPEHQFWLRTSRPDDALERLLERESMFARHLAQEAQELGLETLVVDGSRTLPDLTDEVAEWLELRI